MGKQSEEEKKTNFLLPVIIILALAAAILIIALIIVQRDGSGSEKSSPTGAETETSADENTSDTDENSGNGTDTSAQEGSSTNSEDADTSASSQGTDGSPEAGTGISFPYTASIDELTLLAVYNYSGYYIEDGSEDEIDSVAVLEVTNNSDQVIEYAAVTLTADSQTLTFQISLLPAGATVLVMEADRQSCSETAAFTYEGSEIAWLSSLDMCEDQVSVSTDGSGAITVTNISDETIPELRLFYKNKLDTDEYVGGIAYTVKLENLAAGAAQTVYPSHYDPEYGEVMMVRIYE